MVSVVTATVVLGQMFGALFAGDGTGNPAFSGDVGIEDGVIASVGRVRIICA